MKDYHFKRILKQVLFLSFITSLMLAPGCDATVSTIDSPDDEIIELVQNPLFEFGADPWIIQHQDTFYYCYSLQDRIGVKRAVTIDQLKLAEERIIWMAPTNTMYSKEIWAPELHFIDGKWYVYFAADDGDNVNHRMHMISSESSLITSQFKYLGKITDESDKWAIDGTILRHQDKQYFLWSGWEGDVNEQQNLYIALMDGPTRIQSERTLISLPEYDWEKMGSGNGLPTINEGPQILENNGKIFVIYSASGSWSDHYCLGALELVGEDPLLAESWKKYPEPVFFGNDCVISPGHASFIRIKEQDFIVFHHIRFAGGGWQNRQVKIQPFYWEEGRPSFGVPGLDGSLIRIAY